ncbi:MAG: hypothetical protein U0Z44_11900 [Kouleothrix sp.]
MLELLFEPVDPACCGVLARRQANHLLECALQVEWADADLRTQLAERRRRVELLVDQLAGALGQRTLGGLGPVSRNRQRRPRRGTRPARQHPAPG